MKDHLARRTGSALFWNTVQEAGTNGIYLFRILILARLLSPEDFGLLAISMTAIAVLLSMTDFGMVPALVQHRDVNEQHYHTAWTVGIIRALAISGIVFGAAPFIAHIFAEPRAIEIIHALAILPMIEAAASVQIADLNRNLQFRSLAVVKLASVIVNTILSILLARSFGVWALVAGTLAGPATYTLISYMVAPYRPRLSFDRTAVQPLVRYGRWIFLTSLIAISGGAVLRVIISRQFGAADLGLYFLATKLAFLPNEISSKVVGVVAFPLYAQLQANLQRAAEMFRVLFTGLWTALMPASILIIVLAPSLVDNVLGSRWHGTTTLIQLLATVGLIGLIGDSTVPVLKGLGQPYKFAALEGAQSFILIISAWTLTQRFGLIGAALAWFPAIAGTLLVSIVFLKQILPRPFAGLQAPVVAIAVASGMGAFIALAIDNIIPGVIGLISASILAVVGIIVTLWFLDQRFNIGLFRNLAQAFPQVVDLVGITPANP